MNVVPRKLPESEKTDKVIPIVLWMTTPEIVTVCTWQGKTTLKCAKKLDNQLCFELSDFRCNDVKHSLNKLYYGEIVYSNKDVVKYISTNKGILYF